MSVRTSEHQSAPSVREPVCLSVGCGGGTQFLKLKGGAMRELTYDDLEPDDLKLGASLAKQFLKRIHVEEGLVNTDFLQKELALLARNTLMAALLTLRANQAKDEAANLFNKLGVTKNVKQK
jgi:hypothetical protein